MSSVPIGPRFLPIRDRLAGGGRLRVVFVNDCGFIAGAGIAQRRQVVSLLADGHDVGVVCSLENPEPTLTLRGRALSGRFLGLRCMPELNGRHGPIRDPERITERVVAAVAEMVPDLIVVGNLHWTGWPVDLPESLTRAGYPTVCYMHDCWFITGRCVHPGRCLKFETGCDRTCPTADEYPALEPGRIAAAHRTRREQFAAPWGVPIAGNSRWTVSMAERGLGGRARVDLVPLGLDELLFSPIDRRVARRILGLPQNPRVMLFGATDIGDENKGGPFMRQVCQLLADEPDLMLCAFGHNSKFLKGVHGFGHITDERVMPLLYAASDFYASFSKEETFGQTTMEAAACGRPVIVRRSGGIVDIARDGENAIVVWPDEEGRFAEACRTMALNPTSRKQMGEAGRRLVEQRHTIDASRGAIEAWVSNLASVGMTSDIGGITSE